MSADFSVLPVPFVLANTSTVLLPMPTSSPNPGTIPASGPNSRPRQSPIMQTANMGMKYPGRCTVVYADEAIAAYEMEAFSGELDPDSGGESDEDDEGEHEEAEAERGMGAEGG